MLLFDLQTTEMLTSEDLQYVFKRLEGIPHVTGMIFAGKEALGAPNLTDEH